MQKPKEVRTFRFDSGVLRMLHAVALSRGITENALAEDILKRRLEADPMVEAFGHVGLGRATFGSILTAARGEKLEAIGVAQGRKSYMLAKDLYESNGVDLPFSKYLTNVLDRQLGWFRAEGALVEPEKLTLNHGFGVKWSLFLRGYLSGAYSTATGGRLEINAFDDFLSVRLSRPTFSTP